MPFTGTDAAFLPLVLALSPLSRAEVEGIKFSDMRVPVVVDAAGALALRAVLAGTGWAGVLTDAAVFAAADVFADALPLPDWGALVETFSVALAFAIGTLTFTRTGEKDFAIQTGYCSTSQLAGFPTGEDFT
ncbi:hypothetical protein P3W83_03715 [Cupriavidus basilensis]|uniref:hypothetical protein n=1 Tax=Cupriavidus sp. TaxID=1873897 RepID=UPI003D0C226C|nr:hypothetical protein [Cupriavidus basilensis]